MNIRANVLQNRQDIVGKTKKKYIMLLQNNVNKWRPMRPILGHHSSNILMPVTYFKPLRFEHIDAYGSFKPLGYEKQANGFDGASFFILF
jgi:hypothetical protein